MNIENLSLGIVNTNVGDFYPGEIRLVSPGQESEGRRLVANGGFRETPEAPNHLVAKARFYAKSKAIEPGAPPVADKPKRRRHTRRANAIAAEA